MKLILSIVLLITNIGFAQTTKKLKLLPDSGQKSSYSNIFGEDCDYTINPPFFVNNNDGTITDTVTGLMWQRVDGGEMTFENAVIYSDTLTLGGYTDWRLPSVLEAFSILNLDKLNPALDVNFFPNNNAEYWWTLEKAYNDTNKIWVTNSGGGKGPHPKNETISSGGSKKFHTRAVRNSSLQQIMQNRFTVNQDNTITDSLTGLMWLQLNTIDSLDFLNAIQQIEQLTFSGYSDWRMPNIKELASINNEKANNPSIETAIFTNFKSGKYWSSTSQYPNGTNAWFADFQHYGLTSYCSKNLKLYVIATRNIDGVNDIGDLDVEENNPILFPNPVENHSKISIPKNFKSPFKINVYNTLGEILFTKTFENHQFILSKSEIGIGNKVVQIIDSRNKIISITIDVN